MDLSSATSTACLTNRRPIPQPPRRSGCTVVSRMNACLPPSHARLTKPISSSPRHAHTYPKLCLTSASKSVHWCASHEAANSSFSWWFVTWASTKYLTFLTSTAWKPSSFMQLVITSDFCPHLIFTRVRGREILRSSSSEVAAWYTKIGLLADAPNTWCLLPWRVIRTVVLPILPGGPFYVCKVVLVFVGKQPLIPVRRIVPSSPDLVVQGTTELRHDGVLRSSLRLGIRDAYSAISSRSTN